MELGNALGPGSMTDSFTLWLQGDPRGQQRIRHHGAHHWHDKKTKIAETDIRAAWREAGEPRLPDDHPIGIDITLYYSRPAGHFRKDGSLSAEGQRNPRPLKKKPDIDNAMKLVMDAMNSRAYKDDVRICEGRVEKFWAEWPATKIRIYAL